MTSDIQQVGRRRVAIDRIQKFVALLLQTRGVNTITVTQPPPDTEEHEHFFILDPNFDFELGSAKQVIIETVLNRIQLAGCPSVYNLRELVTIINLPADNPLGQLFVWRVLWFM